MRSIVKRVASIANMPPLVWIALLVLLFATTLGSVHVFLRVRRFWRTFKTFGPALDGTLRELTSSFDRLTTNMDAFGSSTPRLNASLERLRRSQARAAVLRAAVQDVQDSLGHLSAVYPRK
jgi:Flp pilus assembly protein TadB